MCPCVACVAWISSVQVCWIVSTVCNAVSHCHIVTMCQLLCGTSWQRCFVHEFTYCTCTLHARYSTELHSTTCTWTLHVLCMHCVHVHRVRCGCRNEGAQNRKSMLYLTELTFELCCVGMWLVTCTLLSIAYTLSCVTKLSRTKRVLYIFISLSSRDNRILLVFCLV